MTTINFADKVTSDEDALTITTSGELLINFGDFTTTGDLADGIFADADDVTIRNFAHVETEGLGAAGIFVQGQNARIENHGSVHTTGNFFGDFEFFSEGIFVFGDGFYIANHGSIRVEGESSSTMVGVGANGLIINFGDVESSATESSVVAIDGDGSQFINRGQVTSSGGGTAVVFVNGEDASALNHGEILITGDSSNGIQGVIANTHITNRGVIHLTGDNSNGMAGFGDGHEVSNFGLIETHGTFAVGMTARGGTPLGLDGLDLEIVNAGRVATEGDLAIGVALGLSLFGFRAADGQIENRGVIETEGDGAAGVVMIGEGHHLTNSGRITTDGGAFVGEPVDGLRAAAVVVSGDDVLVENARAGVIESLNAGSAAVELNVLERDDLPAADMSSTLENFGLVEGAAIAVLGGDGQETVINHGRIVGDVDLGDGDDTFLFGNGGTVAGDVFLGDGDDRVVIENGSGTTVIADFVAGAASGDQIDVSEFSFSDFDDLTAHSRQLDNDVVVNLDKNDTLVLSNVQLSALIGDDFLFV
jgi:hypothetical protein